MKIMLRLAQWESGKRRGGGAQQGWTLIFVSSLGPWLGGALDDQDLHAPWYASLAAAGWGRRGVLCLWCSCLRFSVTPQVILPDGTRVSYLSASRGVREPGGGLFRHVAPDNKLRDGWVWLRLRMPVFLQHWLPDWDDPYAGFPARPDSYELELRLMFNSSVSPHLWDIGIADEDGWKLRFSLRYIPAGFRVIGQARSWLDSCGWALSPPQQENTRLLSSA